MTPTIERPLQIVSSESLERELNVVRAAAADPLSGVFGPLSMTWRVNREAAIFLGAGRALLLQLAHPWVAAAVEQHSDTFANPVGRFHRTFSTVFTMVFGTLAQSLEAARRLHHRHAPSGARCGRRRDRFPRARSTARTKRRPCAGCTRRSRRQRSWRIRWCCLRSRKSNASAITPKAACSPPCSGFRENVSRATGRLLPPTPRR